MTLEILALNFYLLFPLFSGMLPYTDYSQPWSNKNQEEEKSLVNEMKAFLGIEAFENYDEKTGELFLEGEEGIFLSEDLVNGNEAPRPDTEKAENEEEVSEKFYTGKNSSLRYFEYGEEIYIPGKNIKGLRRDINASKDLWTVRLFDEKNRLLSKKTYSNVSSIEKVKEISSMEYTYQEENTLPSFSEYNDTKKKVHIKTEYNRDGLPLLVEKSLLKDDKELYEEIKKKAMEQYQKEKDEWEKNHPKIETDKENTEESYKEGEKEKEPEIPEIEMPLKMQKESTTSYAYDSEKRPVSIEVKNFFYEDDPFRKDKIIEHTENKKTEYFYHGFKSPDKKYYEEGRLCLEEKYSSEKNWTKTVYFEENMKIIARYENSKKVYEVSMKGDEIISEKNF